MRLAPLLALTLFACGPDSSPTSASLDPVTSAATVAGCPSTWPEARKRCNTPDPCALGTRCLYPHMGDQLGPSPAQWADALLGCFESSSGVGEWRCAQ